MIGPPCEFDVVAARAPSARPRGWALDSEGSVGSSGVDNRRTGQATIVIRPGGGEGNVVLSEQR